MTYIFDFGGVLVDSMPPWAAERLGKKTQEYTFLTTNLSRQQPLKCRYVFDCVYNPSSKDMVDRMKAEYDKYIYDFSYLIK